MRRLLIITAATAALLAVAVTGAWFWAADRLLAEIGTWEGARRAEGYRIEHGPPRVVGFPLSLAAQIPEPVVAIPAARPGAAGWEWRAPGLSIEVVPWNFRRLTLRNRGVNQVILTRDGESMPFAIDSRDFVISLYRPENDTQRIDASLLAPSASLSSPPVKARAETLAASLRLYRAPPGDHLKPAGELTATVDGLLLESAPLRGLETPTSARIATVLMGGIPEGPLAATLPVWRDDGGTIELKQLDLVSAGVSISASGTLALDARMRPIGAASAVIRGIGEAIDRLVAAGHVAPRDASLARIMLTAMSTPATDGGPPVLTVPISGQNGWLYVGPVRLARLEPLKLD